MRVHVGSILYDYTGGATVEAEGRTLDAVLRDLDRQYAGLRFRVVDEQDRVRTHINVFVGSVLTRDLATPLRPNDEVHILGALSGG